MTDKTKLDTAKADETAALAADVTSQADSLSVNAASDLDAASTLLTGIKGLLVQVEEVFGPPQKAAHAAHKAVLDARRKVENPLKSAENIVKLKVSTYHNKIEAEARAAREAEAKRLREQEEEQRLAAAAKVEESGNVAAAERILDSPAPVREPIITTPPPPKTQGISTMKKYTGRVADMEAFMAFVIATRQWDYVTVNQKLIDQHAKAFKSQDRMPPGVELVVDTVVRTTGR